MCLKMLLTVLAKSKSSKSTGKCCGLEHGSVFSPPDSLHHEDVVVVDDTQVSPPRSLYESVFLYFVFMI
jgi:hypothetical protein